MRRSVGAVYDRAFVPSGWRIARSQTAPTAGRGAFLPGIVIILFVALNNIAFAQRPTVALQGTVVRDASGDPLSKARVELRGGPLEPTTTITDTDGKFYFANLPPGAYEISVRRDGFAPAEAGQQWPGGPGVPLQLRAGQPVPDVTLRMVASAAISGRIADSNGQPLANAQVQALKSTFQGELRVLIPVQQVRSNATGDFRLYGLPAGRYFVNVIVPGYSANSQLLVNNGGRTDQGAPYTMNNQPRQILGQSVITASTNPANPQAQDVGPIYFPSTPYIQNAAPIDLRPGAEYKGADTQMMTIRRFTVCGVVRGIPSPQARVQNNPGGPIPPPPPPPRPSPAGQATPAIPNIPSPNNPCGFATTVIQDPVGTVQMVPLDVELRPALNATGNRYNGVVDGATGQFVIRNVLPGLYDLATFISNMDAATTVDVRNRDMENVSLTLSPGFPLPTRITMEGDAPGTPLPGGLTMLIGSSPPTQGTSPNQPVDPKGSFSIPNVGTDDTRVYVLPMLTTPVGPPPNIPDSLQGVYVKSAKLGGVDVLNTGFRFAGEPDRVLEIVLAKNAGSLTGRVEDERKQPVSGVFVTLVPAISTARLYRTDMYKTTSTDVEGRFEVKGLPPGEYKVFALAGFEKDAWKDPEFFKPYEDRGLTIIVGEGRVFTLETPLSVVRQQ